MIEKQGSSYVLSCDYCGNYDEEEFDDFLDAVSHKKATGWVSVYSDGEWFDKCPACLEEEFEDGNSF